MSVNFKPLADRVLIEPIAAETKTASGIIIPDTAKEKPQEGTVVAVGPGKVDEPTTVKVGDNISTLSTNVTVEPTKQYFWRVVVKDNKGGETIGQVWKFKTN